VKTSPRQRQAQRLMDAVETLIHRDVRTPAEQVEAMLDISPPEMRSLMWLARRGMSVMSDFAQGIGVPLSTATRIVNRMVKKGLVARRRSDLDRRIVEIDLSPMAYEHKNQFLAQRLVAMERVLGSLSREESETMLGLLEKALLLSGPTGPDEA
jgi:DNA-binding MarR family transcriptional regulator